MAAPSCGRRAATTRRLVTALVILLAAPMERGRAEVVINELLPDPEGSDSGHEFVELFNNGSETVSLEGLRLEFGNGAVADDWRLRWTGASGDTLAPGRRFLIVDRNWQGTAEAQAEVTLGLQNGPDALRLCCGEQVVDLVGYGPLTDPAMLETEAVPLTPGASLARRPDGIDSDNNAADFVAAEPTPGEPNFAPYALTLLALSLDPPSVLEAGQLLRLEVTLVNTGIEVLPTDDIVLAIGDQVYPALWDACPPDQARTLVWQLRPTQPGLWPLRLRLDLVTGGVLELCVGSVQVGPGALCLNEVLAAPDQGQGEWVELLAVTDVALGTYSLRDEDGPWRTMPPVDLSAGDLIVLAADTTALVRWHRENLAQGAPSCDGQTGDPRCRHLSGAWPTLNNSSPADRDFADRLWLSDRDGCVIDHVTLGSASMLGGGPVAGGRSLERIDVTVSGPGSTNWSTCTAATGSTPGCPNSVTLGGTIAAGLTVVPALLEPTDGVGTVHVRFRLQGLAYGWQARVFDLWGDGVRDFGGDSLGPGPRDLLWDGRDDAGRLLPTGAYVVLLQTMDVGGRRLAAEKALVGLQRGDRP